MVVEFQLKKWHHWSRTCCGCCRICLHVQAPVLRF